MKAPTGRGWMWMLFGLSFTFLGASSLMGSITSAMDSGNVLVTSYARGLPRMSVPWPQAWSYLLGQLLVVLAGVLVIAASLGFYVAAAAAIFVAPVGFVFILLSGYWSSLAGALIFIAINAALFAMIAIDKRFGRLAAGLTWAAIVLFCVIGIPYIRAA